MNDTNDNIDSEMEQKIIMDLGKESYYKESYLLKYMKKYVNRKHVLLKPTLS